MTATEATPVRPAGPGEYKTHPTYAGDEVARQFWRLSFRVGRDYMTGRDASGNPVLVEHEREESDSYRRRLRTTKPRNFVGPILRRYNRLVFRQPPVRDPEAEETVSGIYGAADESGRGIDALMADALLLAQVDRESYLLPDVVRPMEAGAPSTVAAIRAAGSRPVLSIVCARDVVNWRDESGALIEAAIVWRRHDGKVVLRVWDRKTRQDFILDDAALASGSLVVVSSDDAVAHGYQTIPVVRLRPDLDPLGALGSSCGDSQAGPLAESQQAIVNLLSLRTEELFNITFSQMIASGVSESQVKDVKVGNNRVLCLPNPAARVDMIGALPEQARSISDAIADETANLLRTAGINPVDSAQAQSGLAMAFRHNDLATIAGALARACEEAERRLVGLVAGAWGVDAPAPTVYQSKDADLPDFDGEARTMLAIVSNAGLPATVRRKVAERFAARNLSMADDDAEAMRAEIDAAGNLSASPFPFPRRSRPDVEAG